ncbi:MAG: ABC transporter ATP-binding protein [Rhodospirillaceae bacterium]|nr:ABC transporter ATP-binding protein [Rhodospirillaceae bacterium]
MRLNRVAKTFPNGTVALSPVTLSIAPGSFTSLVGPSGCGKSTLLRLIAGLTEPTAGAMTRTARPGGTSFVFQDATLMPWATVADNVALPLRLAGVADIKTKVDEALERVGLAGFGASYPRELSGGMKMRVSIARAVVIGPELLLMDEPFAALDEFTRFKLNDDLLALWQNNRWTVIFVTHSIREAVFLSDRIVIMSPRPGRVVADMAINLPQRDADLRLGHDFADQCARVSAALGDAMHAGAAA